MKAYYLSLSQENFFALEEALEIAISTCDVPDSHKKQHDLQVSSLQDLLFCFSKDGQKWVGEMAPNRLAPGIKYLVALGIVLNKNAHPFKSALLDLITTIQQQGERQDPSFYQTLSRFSDGFLVSV